MEKKAFDLITFGEIMLRLSPPRHARIVDGDIFEKRAGGAELNVASGVALMGLRTGIISRLPQNELGTFIKNRIRFVGVSDDFLTYDDDPRARLGIYYYEMGAAPRKPTIVYDRFNASVCGLTMDDIPAEAFSSARMFHLSGISLALGTRDVAIQVLKKFKENGALISFDVNYRANLWGEDEARETIKGILPLVDVLFVSEETSRRMFQKTGELQDIMKSYAQEYGVKIPTNLSLVSFDNLQMSDMRGISLSSVDPQVHYMGSTAANMMLRRIQDPTRETERVIVKPTLTACL